MCDPGIEGDVAQPEEDDAFLPESVPEDQVTEVLVVGEDGAPLGGGDLENLPIGEGVRVIVTYSSGV